MRAYELLLLMQPELEDDGINGLIDEVAELIVRDGGEMTFRGELADRRGNVAEVTEGWKKRRLAYEVKGRKEGYYAVLRFEAPQEALNELDRVLKLNEDVLRHLTVRTEDKPVAPDEPAST